MEDSTIEILGTSKENICKEPKKKIGPLGYFVIIVKEILAILFWVYVFIKLFVFDIDVFLVDNFLPEYAWFLKYKFFILIGIIALIWLFTKNKTILSWAFYVFFYPIIILFWKIPFFIFKQKSWVLAFAITNSIISFLRSMKYSFIISALYLVSLAVIFNSSLKIFLWSATVMIFGIVLVTYIYRLILIFKPVGEFHVYITILSKFKESGYSTLALDSSIRNLPVESLEQKQIEKWTTNLQTSVLFNRICLFVAKKLRDYQNSGFNFLYYVLTILMLIVLTVFSFAAINYGIFRINNTLFSYPVTPNFFTFFYYSFNNLLFNSIQEIVPVLPISQTVSMMESMFALFLVAIFVSLLFSVRSQRHTDELNKIIKGIERQGEDMESFIKEEYKINSINDAMVELEKMKAGLIKFIYKITESLRY
ncbi:hypothetical protein [Pelotomaculum sp. FP]|uniref:hypothetical protein n=1 Tax=Pelotomaculum sp. FP TaxID=261474 RepID=UPI001066E95F|nr:hypothetical protein [Pelotomaculum sp. FP]